MDKENKIKIMTERIFRDPIVDILLKYSNLTKIQYETLMIDLISEYMSDMTLTYEKKVLFRSKSVSRGSFSRTLSQARKNIISSIYTVLLLSYLDVFPETPFDEYNILSSKLQEYKKYFKNSKSKQSKNILKIIETELVQGITALSSPKSLKYL